MTRRRVLPSFPIDKRPLSPSYVFFLALVSLSVAQIFYLDSKIPLEGNSQSGQFLFSSNDQNFKHFENLHIPRRNEKTLALLYPPGMIGGYRNQVIRFVGLVAFAKKSNISQLLLPSILWSTTYKKAQNEREFYPVPMEMVFDVDHWNSYHQHLPVLVDSISDSDCWNLHEKVDFDVELYNSSLPSNRFISPLTRTVLDKSALLSPIINMTRDITTGRVKLRPRKYDLYPQVENCSRPIVYGGGKGGGRLWNDYVSMPKVIPGANSSNVQAIKNTELISWVSQALQPSRHWRDVAHQCLQHYQPGTVGDNTQSHLSGYVALHTRVEVDMMIHKCGRDMEKNLTKIFSMTELLMKKHNKESNTKKLHGIFVAVSRNGMQQPASDRAIEKIASENWNTLLARSSTGSNRTHTSRSDFPLFECGEDWMNRWYLRANDTEDDFYGSLVPSILNFYIATHANIFVGVARSSWSTDVWTTRYYRGKGSGNFQYTKDGIVPVPNGGLPQAHKNC